jgi:hypothetical protein
MTTILSKDALALDRREPNASRSPEYIRRSKDDGDPFRLMRKIGADAL